MSEQRRIIQTFSELAPRYREVVDLELKAFWGWSYAGFVQHFLGATPIRNGDIVLDIATGTGEIPAHIINMPGVESRIHGLDITLPMLRRATQRFNGGNGSSVVGWTCASAMDMPYSGGYFTLALCCLATHHMEVPRLLGEMERVLAEGGRISIADAGGSALWRFPGVKWVIKLAAFLYFLAKENWDRAWAEAGAVSHVYSCEEWNQALLVAGFEDISVIKMKSKFFWVPSPLVLSATKKFNGGNR